MDPITISAILAALAPGAAKVAGDVAPDVYNGLKALIQKKFAGKPAAEMVLAEYEKDPETYSAPLQKSLVEAGVDKDEEILKAVAELLEKLNPEKEVEGKGFSVHISGGTVQGLTQQNTGTITQDFSQSRVLRK